MTAAMSSYNPHTIEPKWQKYWTKEKLFEVDPKPGKKKYYLLEMLPYPSGRIHMGHVRNYTIGDVATRCKQMQGFQVLHPMGWDAFGMPAENAAIKNKSHPAEWTYSNIQTMKEQLQRMGYSYDWSRELATCDPDYYRWEQLLFIKMVEKGLAYQKKSNVNWCEGCQTVLANEQVEQGRCWRCDTEVTQKLLTQWYFKITHYAEELLRDIDDKMQGWPERVRIMQKEWIGRSEGAWIDFAVEGTFPPSRGTSPASIRIFTTRPDTLFGVTFMSLACEHPLLSKLAERGGRKKEVETFVQRTAKIERVKRLAGDYEKEGVFTGCYCLHPLTKEKIPIFAANFVLIDYGTGAVMAVPAHDQRDFEFAKKHNLPIKIVIQPKDKKLDPSQMTEAYEGEGSMVHSKEWDGLDNLQGKLEITKRLEKQGVGGSSITYKLKDWCLSRQRYWGTPIPMIYCQKCGVAPVLEKDLPVVLPEDIALTGEGGSPLLQHKAFVETKCPRCRGKACRETDTMDTFVESSWYFFRYTSPQYDKAPFDPKSVQYWMPIDKYIGGIEHAVGHLIYCRFFTKVLRDLGFCQLNEPVTSLLTQGMVCLGGSAMSKSRGNVVDPDGMIQKYGADAVRLFILFAAPPEKDLDWNEQGLDGMFRFLGRVWRLVHENGNKVSLPKDRKREEWRHKSIKRVTADIEGYHFNTALSALMEYLNYLQDAGATVQDLETFILLLSPFSPHIAEELWEVLGKKPSLLKESWPTFDPQFLQSATMTIAVQVNGKLRGTLEVAATASEKTIQQEAQKLEKVKAHSEGKKIVKMIYVPKKLLNIVVQ